MKVAPPILGHHKLTDASRSFRLYSQLMQAQLLFRNGDVEICRSKISSQAIANPAAGFYSDDLT